MIAIIKIKLRHLLAFLMYYSGIAPLILFFKTRQKMIALTYHHIVQRDARNTIPLPIGTYVTQDTFRMQMNYIVKHFRLLALHQFEESRLDIKKNKNRCCMVTFDDGWRDNYIHAEEVLKQFNIPAVIFIPTQIVETGQYLGFEKIIYYIIKTWSSNHENRVSQQEQIIKLLHENGLNSFRLHKNLNQYELRTLTEDLKKIDHFIIMNLCSQFAKVIKDTHYNNDPSFPEIMRWDAIAALSNRGVEFGSHTHRHVILTEQPVEIIMTEISNSKELLQNRLQKPITAFAYPDGKWSDTLVQFLKEAGYRVAFTNSYGIYNKGNPFAIPRINIHEDVTCTKPLFACELAGIFRIFCKTK